VILTRLQTFAVVAVVGWFSPAPANGDFCSSAVFKDAFIEGQRAVDWPSVGQTLVKFGDRAVPCLETIARDEAQSFDIPECKAKPRKCGAWAVLALSTIGTPEAERVLRGLLDYKTDPVEIAQVIGSLASNGVREARPAIRQRLTHDSPFVRARAILALGQFGDGRDVDAMIAATMSLPWGNLNQAIRGLEFTGDPRVIGTLEDLAKKFPEPGVQDTLARTIERIQTGKALRPEVKGEKR
jgi:HEAT repeat protein